MDSNCPGSPRKLQIKVFTLFVLNCLYDNCMPLIQTITFSIYMYFSLQPKTKPVGVYHDQ